MRIELSKGVASAVTECFASDRDLIENWHIAAGLGLNACIERTLRDAATFDPTFRFYTAWEGRELLGYWGTEHGNYFNLLFVKPEFRTPYYMRKFWAEMIETVGRPFYAGVYSKNTPAVAFYRRRGGAMETFEYGGHSITAFTFQKVGA